MICIFINSYSKVSNGTWFDVCCDECNATKIFGKDAKEVAKLYGMFLRHSGRLKNYAEKDRPCKILVRWPMGEAHFHAWYSQQTLQGDIQGAVVIIECCFIKKVCISLLYI